MRVAFMPKLLMASITSSPKFLARSKIRYFGPSRKETPHLVVARPYAAYLKQQILTGTHEAGNQAEERSQNSEHLHVLSAEVPRKSRPDGFLQGTRSANFHPRRQLGGSRVI